MNVEQRINIERHKQGSNYRLAISGEMTIYIAQQLKQDFLDTLADCQSLDIDLAEVTEMDSAGFQQLYLLKREANASGKKFSISAHSPATREVLGLYGMQEMFAESTATTNTNDHKKSSRNGQKGKKKP